jgi:hypothetical protein
MSHEEAESFPVRQEEDIVPSGRLVRIVLGTIGVGLLGVFFAGVVLETNTGGIRAHALNGAPPRAAGPTIAQVEQAPILGAAAGLDLQRAQRAELSRYRWVDRDAGVAGIPIERAMDLIVEQSR